MPELAVFRLLVLNVTCSKRSYIPFNLEKTITPVDYMFYYSGYNHNQGKAQL